MSKQTVVLEVLAKSGDFSGFDKADKRLASIDAMMGHLKKKFDTLFNGSGMAEASKQVQQLAAAENQAAKAVDAHADKVAKLNAELKKQQASLGTLKKGGTPEQQSVARNAETLIKGEIKRLQQAIDSYKSQNVGSKGAGVQPDLGTVQSGKTNEVNRSGKVNMLVAGYDVIASLAPGTKVKFVLNAKDIVGGVAPTDAGGKGGAGGGGAGGGGGGGGGSGGGGGGAGAIRQIHDEASGILKTTAALDKFFKSTETAVTKGVGSEKEQLTVITKLNQAGTEWAKVTDGVAKAQIRLKESLNAASPLPAAEKATAAANAYRAFGREVQAVSDSAKPSLLTAQQKTKVSGLVSGAESDAGAITAKHQAKVLAAEKTRQDLIAKGSFDAARQQAKNLAADKKAVDDQFKNIRLQRAGAEATAERERAANAASQKSAIKDAVHLHRIQEDARLTTQRAQDVRNIPKGASAEQTKSLALLAKRDYQQGMVTVNQGIAGSLTGKPKADAQAKADAMQRALSETTAKIAAAESARVAKASQDAAAAIAKTKRDQVSAAVAASNATVTAARTAAGRARGPTAPQDSAGTIATGYRNAATSLTPLLAPAELAKMTAGEAAALQAHHAKLQAQMTVYRQREASLQAAHTRTTTAATATQQMQAAKELANSQITALRQTKAAAVAAIPANVTPQQRALAKADADAQFRTGAQRVYAGMASSAANPAILAVATHKLGVATLAAANATQALNAAQVAAAGSASHIGKNIIQNVQHVTAWAASVGILYGAIGMVRRGVGAFTEVEYQVARLSQVFRGNQDAVGPLTQSILMMAAANGRSAQEAMESAIQWSRLGLNRVEVTEAVRVSLRAANVAEISSAQATEHLSSMMSVYSLRATELEGVLGMLNATSNTFNVTNAQLFEGITRTSAAAKQAGLSLAELVGFIGAGVGNTGQTGANIGNAIKSMIGSLTAPDKQKMLRNNFSFETINANTGGIKDMSSLLGDMFVKLQSLTNAERQSFIFGVAGKNQASRVTALLDNYIKANNLAIHALLNLNSSETENEKIKGTLKNQLVGLITEFERFAFVMTNVGAQLKDDKTAKLKFDFTGGAILKDAVTGLKNLLAAMSAFGGAGGAIVLSFLVALTARLAFLAATTGVAGAGAGFLRNSWAALAVAGREIITACTSAAIAVSNFSLAATVASVKAWYAAVSVGFLTRALVALRVAALVTAGALALALGGLAVFAGIGLIIMAASWGITKLTDALGITSDAADKAFDAITFKAQQAGAAAEAASLQIKLMDTAMRALAAQRSKSERRNIIDKVVEGMEEDPLKRAALRNELNAVNQIADAEQRNAAFKKIHDRVSAELVIRRIKKRQEEAALDLQALRAARAELEKLNRSWFASAAAKKAQIEKIETLEKRRKQRAVDDDSDRTSLQDAAAQGEPHKKFVATTQSVMDDIKNLFADMPGSMFGDMLNKEMMTLNQQLQVLEDQKLALEEKRKAIGGTAAAEEDARLAQIALQEDVNAKGKAALENQIALRSEQLSAASKEDPNERNPREADFYKGLSEKDLRSYIGAARSMPDSPENDLKIKHLEDLLVARRVLNDLEAEGARLTAEKERLEASSAGRQGGDMARVNAALKENEARREGIRIEAEAANQRRAAADIRDQRAAGGLFAGGDIDVAGAYGNNPAQENAARLAEARRIAAASAAQAARLGNTRSQQSESADVFAQFGEGAAEFDLRNQAAQTGVELELELGKAMRANAAIQEELTRTVNEQVAAKQAVIKAEKDYQRSIALAGPAEMLRKMAISKMTNNFQNNNGGQFLAWDEGARRDMQPQFGARGRLRDANANMANNFGNGNRDQQMEGYWRAMKAAQDANLALMARAASSQSTALNTSARAAVEMTTALGNASAALRAFSIAVANATATNPAITPQNNTGQPRP